MTKYVKLGNKREDKFQCVCGGDIYLTDDYFIILEKQSVTIGAIKCPSCGHEEIAYAYDKKLKKKRDELIKLKADYITYAKTLSLDTIQTDEKAIQMRKEIDYQKSKLSAGIDLLVNELKYNA